MRKIRRLALLFLLLLTYLGGTSELRAADPRAEIVTLTAEDVDQPITLGLAWRYWAGDDINGAAIDIDDSSWPLVRPSLQDLGEVRLPGGWNGIGWFRRKIRTDDSFGGVAGFFIYQAGASEIYLDGNLIAKFGTVSADPATEKPFSPQYVTSLTLEPNVDHVLAVRYSNASGNVLGFHFQGFNIAVGEVKALTREGIGMIRRYTAFMAGGIGIFGSFAVLHLLLFAFRPKTLENLFFAIFAVSVVGIFATEVRMNSESDLSRVLLFHNWFITFSITMALSALLVEYRVFWKKVGWTFYLFAGVAVLFLGWAWTRPALTNLLPVLIFLAIVYAEALRLAVMAIVDKKPDAWVVGTGFLVFTVWIFLSTLRGLGWIPVAPEIVASTGLGVLALSFSVYLTRQIARTNRQLEDKLSEVETLTERTIEHERRAAREEAERRVLEADNARTTAELEEARQLQLAMLPEVLPDLPNYDLAVHMTTAYEVGGDYYDFHTNGRSSCTLVVGDATGHGLHAGMVVGVAKSLFQSWCAEPDLGRLLRQIGDGLSSMHRRQASMAMVLLRLAAGRIRFASAGMPPLLVWRHETDTIDEILAPNVPLGTLSDIEFPENEISLLPGDSLLVMTDGLVELTDPDGEPLGYDRAAEIFAQVAHLDPEEAIEALLKLAADYHSGTPLHDDMTLVLLKSRL